MVFIIKIPGQKEMNGFIHYEPNNVRFSCKCILNASSLIFTFSSILFNTSIVKPECRRHPNLIITVPTDARYQLRINGFLKTLGMLEWEWMFPNIYIWHFIAVNILHFIAYVFVSYFCACLRCVYISNMNQYLANADWYHFKIDIKFWMRIFRHLSKVADAISRVIEAHRELKLQ